LPLRVESVARGSCLKCSKKAGARATHETRKAQPAPRKAAKPATNGKADDRRPTTDAGTATICVSEAALDRFWTRLSVGEKAEIFTLNLESQERA
jgi:hypothetical protein